MAGWVCSSRALWQREEEQQLDKELLFCDGGRLQSTGTRTMQTTTPMEGSTTLCALAAHFAILQTLSHFSFIHDGGRLQSAGAKARQTTTPMKGSTTQCALAAHLAKKLAETTTQCALAAHFEKKQAETTTQCAQAAHFARRKNARLRHIAWLSLPVFLLPTLAGGERGCSHQWPYIHFSQLGSTSKDVHNEPFVAVCYLLSSLNPHKRWDRLLTSMVIHFYSLTAH